MLHYGLGYAAVLQYRSMHMSRTITLSDETYETLASVASALGETPEALIEAWATSVPPAEERDPDQAWFWTPRWQAMEREADADLAAGRVTHFESDEEFLDALRKRAKHADS
jgi:predicted transcriptional regulator